VRPGARDFCIPDVQTSTFTLALYTDRFTVNNKLCSVVLPLHRAGVPEEGLRLFLKSFPPTSESNFSEIDLKACR